MKARENQGAERDIEGVGWDMSIPLKLVQVLYGNGGLFPSDVRMLLLHPLIREFSKGGLRGKTVSPRFQAFELGNTG